MSHTLLRIASLRNVSKLKLKKNNLKSFSVDNECRLTSSWSGTMTDLNIDEEKGFAKLIMKNPAGNALASPMIQEMSQAITEVEKTKCRGLVLSSAVKNIFCSGLNLAEFGGPGSDVSSVTKYYSGFQDLWFQLFKSPLITIAAMNGHAIAGGCAIGMACDYRILATPKYGIGMNEILFGVAVPYYLLDMMILIMGWHNASKAALCAKIFNADEALKVGLVDELSSLGDMDATVEKVLKQYLKGNRNAQVASKMDARQNFMDNFPAVKEKDLNRVVGTVNDPRVKKVLYAYIASITKQNK